VNRVHHFYCSREAWKRHVREDLVPAALEGVGLGDDVLEVGPGFGPATEALAARVPRLTALEIDPDLAAKLRERLGERVAVREGDGTSLPFEDGSFSGAACFTMLHHVPTGAQQDRLFAEVRRVLRPGGTFVGTDSTGRGLGFALLHVGDVRNVVDPQELPLRLEAAGFAEARVDWNADTMRFRAS
jgi:ubiquinone/menaquinone biosynthesis C-methylase UbiE